MMAPRPRRKRSAVDDCDTDGGREGGQRGALERVGCGVDDGGGGEEEAGEMAEDGEEEEYQGEDVDDGTWEASAGSWRGGRGRKREVPRIHMPLVLYGKLNSIWATVPVAITTL